MMIVPAAYLQGEDAGASAGKADGPERRVAEAASRGIPAALDVLDGQVDAFARDITTHILRRAQSQNLPTGDAHIGIMAVYRIAPASAVRRRRGSLGLENDLNGLL